MPRTPGNTRSNRNLNLHYSVDEVCAIIKACRDGGVTQLKIGDFEASFLSPEPKASEVATPTPEQLAASREYENEAFLENEKRIREDELAQIRLSDPEMFEELQNRGELENAGKESEGIDA